ncbi:MAG: hypothetical protein A3F09_00060 [Chlamydiae bacterium RIFCSPHIGHO2_12_FULL_49_11]|nr:MAG: hypothetical protein A3F09_00060 [Chlamydiae bacterium RIFCSPHIGHO2_12_FULL_49_11]
MKFKSVLSAVLLSLFLFSCGETETIVMGADERQANLIIVFLDSKGIEAQKQLAASTGIGGGEATQRRFNITVDKAKSIQAMAILNNFGLPQRQGTSLLELFAQQGLMTTDKQETIRYQAGLAQQITNMILLIDGVIDATVQLSFPDTSGNIAGEQTPNQKITASVFVKHQGVLDDPNSHLESKIKRLVSGSVTGLNLDDVTVVSDRSRYTDITASPQPPGDSAAGVQNLVKIWSITMDKSSLGTFRFLFFFLIFIGVFLALILGWILWKVYPTIKENGGLSTLLDPLPFLKKKKQAAEIPEETISGGDDNITEL